MNYKKAFIFVGLFPLLLSCTGNSHYGEYVFQMGKNKDTHIGVSLQLTKELYAEAEPEKGEKYILSLDMVTSDVQDSMSEILKSLSPLTGFYKVEKETKVYGETGLHIGINLLGEYEVPQSITDAIFVASLNSTLVNFYLPVSFEDLSYQLYWYGWDLNLDNIISAITEEGDMTDPIESVDGHHPLDVHPTKEEIDKINEHYPDAHNGNLFRDFHVLKLGLTRK